MICTVPHALSIKKSDRERSRARSGKARGRAGGGGTDPVFLKLGALTIHWYGVLMALAFLAGLGVGVFDSYQDIDTWLRHHRTIEPNPENTAKYEKYWPIYLELYQRTKDLMHETWELS